jgi:hypothetical protein
MPGFMQLGVALVELHLICDDGVLFVNLVPPLLLHDQKAQGQMCLSNEFEERNFDGCVEYLLEARYMQFQTNPRKTSHVVVVLQKSTKAVG